MNWPHAPLHRLDDAESFMVTGGTLYKKHFFYDAPRLDLWQEILFSTCEEYDWKLQAWALFSNHYHMVITAGLAARNPQKLLRHFHSKSSMALNKLDRSPGRQVLYQFWDTRLTFQKSFLARLSYVHRNPVKHELASVPEQYPWCSARWFEKTATPSFQRTVAMFTSDALKIIDDFEPKLLPMNKNIEVIERD